MAAILEAHSMIRPKLTSTLLTEPDYETDLLIIGGGGAGCWAAITAARKGMKSLIATKLRMGDANTMMSEGGMQAAVSRTDSPTRHYLDAMGGGHFDNDPALVRVLTEDAPEVVRELENLGVIWDKMPDGSMQVLHGGGTSRKRMVSCRDYIGAIIMRTLMDEVRNHPDMISVREFEPAVELLLDEQGPMRGRDPLQPRHRAVPDGEGEGHHHRDGRLRPAAHSRLRHHKPLRRHRRRPRHRLSRRAPI